MPSTMVTALLIAFSIFSGLSLLLECGYRLGRRAVRQREAPSGGIIGAVQGAVLGLLGLLLGFSFAGASARFLERQDLIVHEANAIGTAALRADLLLPEHRIRLSAALAEYLRDRIEAGERMSRGDMPDDEDQRRVEQMHAAMWNAAVEQFRPQASSDAPPLTAEAPLVLTAVNEVIDIHALRRAAVEKHLPRLVLVMLIICSGVAMLAIGFGCGVGGRRVLGLTGPLVFLVGTALWTTIDMDNPRAGIIRISDDPLHDVVLTPPAISTTPPTTSPSTP
jgi:hypothetical protein